MRKSNKVRDVHHWVLFGWALVASLALLPAPLVVHAEATIISAEQASRKAAGGELLIIDVRTSAEWRETGVPAGAARANIFDGDFLQRVKAAVGENLSRPIAVICARGNRSTRAEALLSHAGFTNVRNIKEGMLGSAHGPGWLAGGHPTERCTEC